MEVGGQSHDPTALPLENILGTHFTGGGVGPISGQLGCRAPSFPSCRP